MPMERAVPAMISEAASMSFAFRSGIFVSAIWRDNVYATQFHPEKSQRVGLTILKNFAEL